MVDITTTSVTIKQEWTYLWSYKQEFGKILKGIYVKPLVS